MRVDPNCVLGTHECTGYTFNDDTDRYVTCGCECHSGLFSAVLRSRVPERFRGAA